MALILDHTQPYVRVLSSSDWRQPSGEPKPFTSGSRFQLQSADLPAKAVKHIRGNLHLAFGDFDDHLEDVTIGKSQNICVL